MSTKEKEKVKRNSNVGPGKRRLGTVVSNTMCDRMSDLTMVVATTNSNTVCVVVEEWLVKTGMLKPEDRVHPPEVFKRLDSEAKKLAKACNS